MSQNKFDILIVSHGKFCEGIADSIGMILGIPSDEINTVSFNEGQSIDDFKEKVESVIESIETNKVIILTDIIGGTPANVCMHLANEDIHIVTGMHLALAIDLFVKKINEEDFDSLNLNEICEDSKKGILHLNSLLEKKG